MAAIKTALLICEKHGLQYLFVISAGAIFTSGMFAAFFMPETHGLSLKAIGEIYRNVHAEVSQCKKF
jgi:hypothetical protein